MVKKPDKYLPENQTWYKGDSFTNCKKLILKCPKCQHLGHYSEHLNQNKQKQGEFNIAYMQRDILIQVDFYIHHSHFIVDLDKGRHVRCKIGDEWRSALSDPRIKTMYRSSKSRDVPGWVKDELGYNS